MDSVIELNELEWIAFYGDDSFLPQFEEDGTENSYGKIERERLTEFRMLNRQTGAAVLVLSLDPGCRLIYRRRNFMNGISGDKENLIYLVGWQKTIKGENVQSLNWILQDGTIINTGRFVEGHVYLNDIVFLPFEEEGYTVSD